MDNKCKNTNKILKLPKHVIIKLVSNKTAIWYISLQFFITRKKKLRKLVPDFNLSINLKGFVLKTNAKKYIICEFKIHNILRGCEGTHSLTVLISISSLFRIVRNEKDIMVIELCQYLQQRRSPSWFHRYFCVRDFNPIWWHCPLFRSKLPFLCETILSM